MKILATGAAGMLFADVLLELLRCNHQVIQTDINLRLPEIRRLDVSDLNSVLRMAREERPDYIFHFSAETNVDLCQRNPDHAFSVNAGGTENIALACRRYDIPLLYISTGAVFSGDKAEPYAEFDKPNPLNIYGESKLQGELAVEKLLSKYFIIRAGWMIGGWELDKKFVYKIVQQLKGGKQRLRVVFDKFGSPTFTRDFAKNLLNVINSGRYGLYHMTNKGTCSRYDIAVKVVEYMHLADRVKIDAITSAEFPLPAPRGRSEMLRNYELDLLGLNNMPRWEVSLEEYIRTYTDKKLYPEMSSIK